MMMKQKVKFTYTDAEDKKRYATITVYGRTAEELNGRVEKTIFRKTTREGWELR